MFVREERDKQSGREGVRSKDMGETKVEEDEREERKKREEAKLKLCERIRERTKRVGRKEKKLI